MITLFLGIKHKLPFIWAVIETVNGFLVGVFFPRIRKSAEEILEKRTDNDYNFSLVKDTDLPYLSEFLRSQPQQRLERFRPHGFDEITLRRLNNNRGYLLMKITSNKEHGKITGYFFLRIFIIGKAFHGLITDNSHEGRGLGTAMWDTSARICRANRLKMFATICSDNKASLISAGKGCVTTVTEQLPDNYLLIRCEPRQETC